MSEVIDGNTGKPDPHSPVTAANTPLNTALDVRREMAKVYRGMRGKEIDSGEGTKLIYALSAIGKMIEVHEFERRIAELEEHAAGRGNTALALPARAH